VVDIYVNLRYTFSHLWTIMQDKKLTIAMAGGGSGGHVYPIKSLIQFMASQRDYRNHVKAVYRFGKAKSLEEKEFLSLDVKKQLPVFFVTILSGKLRRQKERRARIQNLRDVFLFVAGFFQSLRYLHKYKIDVIFCK